MKTVYHGMTRAQLDEAYNLQAFIPDYQQLLKDFQQRSNQTYQTFSCRKNVHYAPSARTTFDYFPSKFNGAPTVIFIHGGFWQFSSKDLYAFIVNGMQAHYQVILAEYTLAPQADMTQIVGEIGTLLRFLSHNAQDYQLQPGKVCLSGHSAGGHLAAIHRTHPLISHAMWLSGIVDLLPMSLCNINDNLQLTPTEIQLFSPMNNMTKSVPTAVHVGSDERSEMLDHSDHYAHLLEKVGNSARYSRIEGCNHFTLLNELSRPDGQLVHSLHRLFKEQ